jgi:hypothetical protein
MCATCERAKASVKRGGPSAGLAVIGAVMSEAGHPDHANTCLDATIGEIAGLPEVDVDQEKDAAWAKGNSWKQ